MFSFYELVSDMLKTYRKTANNWNQEYYSFFLSLSLWYINWMAVITFEIERVTTNKLQLNSEWIDVKISMFFFEIYCFFPLHDFPSTALNEEKNVYEIAC